MKARQFESRRGILVSGLSLDFTLGKIVEYGEISGGKKQPHLFALGTGGRAWVFVGVPANMSRYNFHNLACWLTGLSGDSEHATEVIAVSVAEGEPEHAYYLVPDKEASDAAFIGRREDGASMSVDIPLGTVKVSHGAKGPFQEPLLDFLRTRNVPESLFPARFGFELTPERELTVAVEDYEP